MAIRILASLLFVLAMLGAPPAAAAASGAAGDDTFSWRQCQGQTVRVLLNNHPYAVGIQRQLGQFEALTGIKVAYAMYSEDRYFPQLEKSFGNRAGRPDVYMTGPYQVWEYAPAGRMAQLDPFILNPAKTRATYNHADFFPRVSGAFRWNGKPGEPVGEGPLWAVPLGFECSSLIYNREVLARFRLPPPGTLDELLATGTALNRFEGKGTYGVALRGMGAWNSLHSGYIAALANYGGRDMAVENGRLVSKVNSPEAVAVTELWVKLLQECGPPDWEYYDWYRCLEDIGNRKAALLFDSDVLGYYANHPGASLQSGKLGLALPPRPSGKPASEVKSNLWAWGLAINPTTPYPDAAWIFVQYFTSRDFQLWSVLNWKAMNPPRRSVFEDAAVQLALASMEGYSGNLKELIDRAEIFFTPNPHFTDITERWAAVVRDIANGMYNSTQEGLDALKIWMDNKLADIRIEAYTN